MGHKLPESYYLQADVVAIAKDLIGKRICTQINGIYTSGLISETEAYAGETDKASHAYGGRYTVRTKPMFAQGGIAYVYLCYGIHHLFNVVTNHDGIPHAVLIRAIKPEKGVEYMLERRNFRSQKGLADGPGKTSKALGISTHHNGLSLLENEIWIEDMGIEIPDSQIQIGPRIGIDYAEEDKDLPYRFLWKG
ncbi:MAG: DNA-3-methyladenine glycosylase [Bacteroidia bacterium]